MGYRRPLYSSSPPGAAQPSSAPPRLGRTGVAALDPELPLWATTLPASGLLQRGPHAAKQCKTWSVPLFPLFSHVPLFPREEALAVETIEKAADFIEKYVNALGAPPAGRHQRLAATRRGARRPRVVDARNDIRLRNKCSVPVRSRAGVNRKGS